ncbi:MAG: hypothetical protein ACI399_06665 [Candidatus Cryptobacteroides sp.]
MNAKLKSFLNATWKVGLLGAGVSVFSIILVIAYYEGHHGRNERRDSYLPKDVVVRAYKDKTVRIWNKATKQYTTKKIRRVSGEPCDGGSLTLMASKDLICAKIGFGDECIILDKKGVIQVPQGRIDPDIGYL